MCHFFAGHDRAAGTAELDRMMIAAHNVTAFEPPRNGWMLDSGGFRILTDRGRYEDSAAEYIRYAKRLEEEVGGLVAVFQQDAPLTPAVRDALDPARGYTTLRHKTIGRYVGAKHEAEAVGLSAPVAPVLHGMTQDRYVTMAKRLSWSHDPKIIGIGGLKAEKHDADGRPSPAWLRELVLRLRNVFPEARFHALGIGKRYILNQAAGPTLRRELWSYDSAAWKVRARYAGRDQNHTAFANEYAQDLTPNNAPLFNNE